LDLGLDVLDVVRRLHLQSDGLSREGLDENLHASTETQHKVKCRLLLDVVVAQSATIFQLLAGKDQTLLVGRNALLVLDLGLDRFNVVRGLHIERDGLARERLDEDLHAAAQTKHQVQRRLFLDVVVGERATVLQLLAGKDQTLLIRRNANFRKNPHRKNHYP
jgi:hypothetical protein